MNWARIRILQACERLRIPEHLWPSFRSTVVATDPHGFSFKFGPAFALPDFDALRETEGEWRSKALAAFNTFLNEQAKRNTWDIETFVKQKVLIPIKQTRDTTPLNLRYEWAAQRLCYNTPYSQLARPKDGYNEERIKKTVQTVFKDAGIRSGKRHAKPIFPSS